MRIEKMRCRDNSQTEHASGHVLLSNRALQCNCVVRDWIYPMGYVFVDITKDGNILITPTMDKSGYKVSKFGGQVRITYCQASQYLNIPEHKRIYCERLDDGKILCKANEAYKNE